MKVVKPIDITNENLINSTVLEPDPYAGEVQWSFDIPDAVNFTPTTGYVLTQGTSIIDDSGKLLVAYNSRTDNEGQDYFNLSTGALISSGDRFPTYYRGLSVTGGNIYTGDQWKNDANDLNEDPKIGVSCSDNNGSEIVLLELDWFASSVKHYIIDIHVEQTGTRSWVIYHLYKVSSTQLKVRKTTFTNSTTTSSYVEYDLGNLVNINGESGSMFLYNNQFYLLINPSSGTVIPQNSHILIFNYNFSSLIEDREIPSSSGAVALNYYDGNFYLISHTTSPRNGTIKKYNTDFTENTAYQEGDEVILTSTHRRYIAAMETSISPDLGVDLVPPQWIDNGPTNRFKMFNDPVGAATESNQDIVVNIQATGIITAISAFNILNADYVNVIIHDSFGTKVYDEDVPLIDNSEVVDWWHYYFEPVERKRFFAINGLPSYANATIQLTFYGSTPSVGRVVLGQEKDIGVANYGTSLGLLDYSRKETDDFGNYNVIRRGTSKLTEYDVSVQKSRINYVFNQLSDLSTIPCVWSGQDTIDDPTTVYGYYKDATINIDSPSICSVTISVEGLV